MPLSAEKKKQAIKMMEKFLKDHKDEEQKKIKIGFLGDNSELGKINKLTTGLIGLDTLTDGGFIKGHINLVYGGEGAGKTTTFFEFIKACQKNKDFLPGYVSAEKSLDRTYAQQVGVNIDELIVMEGETAENNTDFCIEATDPANGYDLLIVDTLQALSSKQELYKGSSQTVRSTEDNSMALLPRVYSQFFRMYTSKSVGSLTLLLGSQVRTDLSNPMFAVNRQTGGNALKHYNLLTIEMKRLSDGNWPSGADNIPPNSFVVKLKLDKAKIMNRYRGNTINIYFKEGKFDHKFNLLAIAKDLGITDGKTLNWVKTTESYHNGDIHESNEVLKAKGFNDMYNNKMTSEIYTWLETQIPKVYTKQVLSYIPEEGDTDEDSTEHEESNS
jgi:recombination protein RecA